LRENHRQPDDNEFLIALNKVRIGDASVLDYMNNTIFPINVESSETLVMAKEKSAIVWENYKQSIKDRMNWDHIISNRNNMESGTIVTQQFQERIDNARNNSLHGGEE
jgi:hypothetical protein